MERNIFRHDLLHPVFQPGHVLHGQLPLIRLAQVDAIGAVRQAVIGVYDLEEQVYHREDLEGIMEIASLSGSVTTMNGEVYPHLHTTLAGQDNKVHAGHVIGLVVGATCEMFVRVLDGEVNRVRDDKIGINTIRF